MSMPPLCAASPPPPPRTLVADAVPQKALVDCSSLWAICTRGCGRGPVSPPGATWRFSCGAGPFTYRMSGSAGCGSWHAFGHAERPAS